MSLLPLWSARFPSCSPAGNYTYHTTPHHTTPANQLVVYAPRVRVCARAWSACSFAWSFVLREIYPVPFVPRRPNLLPVSPRHVGTSSSIALRLSLCCIPTKARDETRRDATGCDVTGRLGASNGTCLSLLSFSFSPFPSYVYFPPFLSRASGVHFLFPILCNLPGLCICCVLKNIGGGAEGGLTVSWSARPASHPLLIGVGEHPRHSRERRLRDDVTFVLTPFFCRDGARRRGWALECF